MLWHEVLTAVRALLDAEFPSVAIGYQNETFTPPTDAAWVYLELLPIDGYTSDFNSDGLRVRSASGLIAGHCFSATGIGAVAGMQLAEEIGLFLQTRTISAGVQTGGYEVAGAASGDDEGNYFRVSVTIPVSINMTI